MDPILLQLLMANNQADNVVTRPGSQNMGQIPLLGGSSPQGFNVMENGSLQGVLGGMGREGGGALGALFGGLFGDNQGTVNLGGGNKFMPGKGMMKPAQGPVMPGGSVPMASGFDFESFMSSLFGV